MDEKVLMAALAGLLHDVGKIEQRTLVVPRASAPGYESDGQPAHATYSAYFAQNHVPQAYRAAALAGAYHHVPERSPGQDKWLSKLIAVADKLSAGERADDVSAVKKPPRQMMTIFNRVSLAASHQEVPSEKRRYLPLKPLSLNANTIFPGDLQDKDAEGDGYLNLLEELSKVAREDPGDLQVYIENILGAMQSTAWCIPSAYYYSAPDVSLYDHSRMTGALAVCMSQFPESELDLLLDSAREAFKDREKKKSLTDTPIALLIGGDISGIQNFIYTITSKKAAKTLRGRSFYLQLLTEAVLRYVLNRLGLPYTNVIYSGGGHFFILAPVNAKEEIAGIRSEITKKIVAHHETNLYFALGFTEVPASGFQAGKFPEYWHKMHAQLGVAKQQRYTELGDEAYESVFSVHPEGGNPDDTCSVCGGDTLQTKRFDDYDETKARICSLCDSFSEELGTKLTEASFVALGWCTPQNTTAGSLNDALRSFGLQFQLLENEKGQIHFKDVDRVTVWALDDPENGYPKADVPAACLLRYTVKDIPDLTFDELQNETGSGFKRLGVLRMDVDNLGDVFKKGLGDKYATLARVSMLSFQLSLFFEGWIKRICEKDEFKGKIYAVYAGGDDVFLVGPWDVMPDLALKIRNDFASYTGGYSDLHISAGLAFIGGKYPIYQAAEDAEDVLKSAKNNPGKDSFGYLGNVWKWSEFEQVREKFLRMVRIVDELRGPHAIIQTLRELAEMKAKRSKDGKEVWGPWQWQGAYSLKRMEERNKGKPDLAKEIIAIRNDLEPNYANINQWGAAARWAQLKTRKKAKNLEDTD